MILPILRRAMPNPDQPEAKEIFPACGWIWMAMANRPLSWPAAIPTDCTFGMMPTPKTSKVMCSRRSTNGLGLNQDLEYKPLTDSTVYTAYTGGNTKQWGNSKARVTDMKKGPQVVSRLITTHGRGNNTLSASTRYKYEGLRRQAGGIGSLGFARFSRTDEQTGVTNHEYFHQHLPYKGRLYKTESLTNDGQVIRSMEIEDWNYETFL